MLPFKGISTVHMAGDQNVDIPNIAPQGVVHRVSIPSGYANVLGRNVHEIFGDHGLGSVTLLEDVETSGSRSAVLAGLRPSILLHLLRCRIQHSVESNSRHLRRVLRMCGSGDSTLNGPRSRKERVVTPSSRSG